MPRKAVGELTGIELRPPALESDFRARHLREDGRTTAVVVCVITLLNLVFVLNDLHWMAGGGARPALFLLRAVMVVIGVLVGVWAFRTRRPATLDLLVLAWIGYGALLSALVQATRPRDYFLPGIADALLVLVAWVVLPNRYALQALGAAVITACSAWWLTAFRDRPPAQVARLIGVTFFLSNLIGAFVSWRFHRSRRRQFLAEREEASLSGQLRESEELFRTAFDNASIGKALCAPDGRFLRVNDSLAELLGFTHAEFVGMRFADVTHPDDREASTAIVRRMVQGLPHAHMEKRYLRKDGTVVWGVVTLSLVRDASGAPLRFVVGVLDVTARRRAEEALVAARSRFADLYESVGGGIVRVASDGRILEENEAYRRMVGYSADELHRMTYMDLTPERWRAPEARAHDEGFGAGAASITYEKEYRRRDGTVLPVELRVFAIREGGRVEGDWAIVRDITDRKRAEDALRASEARFRALAEDAPVGIFETDARGVVVYANRAAAEMTGLPQGSIPGRSWADVVVAEDRDRIDREWRGGGPAGGHRTHDYRMRRDDGRATLVRGIVSALPGPDATPRGFIAVALDVTEESELREKLAVASRLAALGTLVAGIAHEINNPLGGALASHGFVAGEVERMRERLRAGEPVDGQALLRELDELAEALGDAQAAEQRVAAIVRDLAVFGRPDPRRARLSLSRVVEGAVRWAAPALAGAVDVDVEDAGAPDVVASEGQLVQVLSNLLANAAKSMPSGRRGRIRVRLGPGEAGRACIEVADDGGGMSPETMRRMFDPFFTTREVGKGMGLGLAISHAIVSSHGGTISATSTPGKGSTFRVELPSLEEGTAG